MAVSATSVLAYFGSTPGEVYRVWLNGRRIDLTESPADDTFPVVSPDGRRVAFVSDPGERGGRRGRYAHLYLLRSDGRALRRISSALPTDQSLGGQLAWSPDGERLAVDASMFGPPGQLETGLYVIGPGRQQRLVARAPIILGPAWSPDGGVIAFNTGDPRNNQVWAVTPSGRRAWRVKGISLGSDGRGVWARTGRLAVLGRGRATVRVYDERGGLRMSFPGRSFAWSPDGKRLASVTSERVEVRALSGRLLFRKAVP